MMEEKKTPVVFLAGTVDDYREHWDDYEHIGESASDHGFAVLNPAQLPAELRDNALLDIAETMFRNADAVLFVGPSEFFAKGCQVYGKPFYSSVSQLCEEVPRCF